MPAPTLPWPTSRQAIAQLQSGRKRAAVEHAKRSAFFAGRLDHVNVERLDDPSEWAKIPILDKEQLRALPAPRFYRDFCNAPRADIAQYWRSGGTTGKPLFYPRTHDDIRYAMAGFRRTFECMGIDRSDIAHLSFPLGIHPAGQMWARAAEELGIGVAWAGAGAAAPSMLQLELLSMLEPTVWMGMSSYGLHLANLADVSNINLAQSSVKRICCTAEPLSDAKREKLTRDWGATVYDSFGMTECAMMASEASTPGELHIWTDLAYIEVLDPDSFEPVPEGEPGELVMTSLFTNHCTPFLRWRSGDIVVYQSEGSSDGPWSVFPVIRHTHRTAGFFKVRGVNIGHAELEDYLFSNPLVNDFKAEALATSGLDALRLSIELKKGTQAEQAAGEIGDGVKASFELTPEVVVLDTGTLAKEFESAVKAPRFVDKRSPVAHRGGYSP